MPPTQRTATDPEGSGVIPPERVPAVDLRDPQYRTPTLDDLTGSNEDSDPEPVLPPAQNQPSFTAEQIEKARREEREKVLKRLQGERTKNQEYLQELEELRKFREEKEAEQAKAQREAERKARKEAEKDLSAKEILAKREEEWERQRQADRAEWEARLEAMNRDREQERAQLKLEREALELQNYIATEVARAVKDKEMAPQFVDFINGTSKEQVDAQIEVAKAKTAEILSEVTGQQQAAQRQQGVSTASGPSSMGSVTEVTDQPVDFTKLTLKDYVEKVRPKLQIDRRDNGIFG